MDDSDIVALYHRREERAIIESDKKYGRLCRCVAMRLLALREDAEECVNDTWYAAWNRMPPECPQALGAFFGRITRNLAVSRYRREHAQKRFEGMAVLLSELEDCVPAQETVEEALDRKRIGHIISVWLDGLKPEERRLFVRRYWYGETVKAIAAELGEDSNTISQRLLRLRKALRAFFESEGMDV